jgi:MFS family permease
MNLSKLTGLHAGVPPRLRSNIIHYYFDMGWWGLYAGATAAFLSIYAARIGASATQIGLLSALPSAISLCLSLPFSSLVRRLSAHRATWIAALVGRSLLLVYAVLPFFFTRPQQVTAVLVMGAVMAVPNTLVGISFSQLLMESITPDWRGTVVGARNAFYAIVTFLATMLSGQLLTHLAFPTGYQVVFLIGAIGATATTYHLYRVRPLTSTPPLAEQTVRRMPRYFPPLNAAGKRYIRVLAILFLFNAINNMVAPLVPGVLVNNLRLSDDWISIGTAANNLILFVVSLFIASLTRRLGNRQASALGAALLAGQALALALAHGLTGYLVSVVASGLGSGVLNTAQFNYHLDNVPEEDRPVWLSWNLLMGNLAILIGALAGPLLAQSSGVLLALGILAGLRLLMGLVIERLG